MMTLHFPTASFRHGLKPARVDAFRVRCAF